MVDPRKKFRWRNKGQAIDHIVACLQEPCTPLTVILRHMEPHLARSTFNGWREADPALHERLNEAADIGHDATALQIIDITDGNHPIDVDECEKDPHAASAPKAKSRFRSKDPEKRDLMRAEYRHKLLQVWSRSYTKRNILSGDDQHPLNGMSDEQVKERFEELMAKANQADGLDS
jgi:hypothetical protein